jgi:2-polyprenyl-3-methyl-5-hydroxy-6-metoxy-1,4-benzoquinol methylase
MTDQLRTSPDFPEMTQGTTPVWDNLAEWWDDKIGDGNATQDYLVEPTQERLLGLKPGEQVLDVACGAGRFTRRMASSGARIVAFDHSNRFIERARRRTTQHADRIEYRVLNATHSGALLALGRRSFDAAVCTMALMDMAEITPLFAALRELLKPGGRFVWSVTHPVFNSGDARLTARQEESGTALINTFAVSVSGYLNARHYRGIGVPGQPEVQDYFHRPLSMLLNAAFENGFVLDRLEEPAFPPDLPKPAGRPLSWVNFTEIPQVLVARMRLHQPGAS